MSRAGIMRRAIGAWMRASMLAAMLVAMASSGFAAAVISFDPNGAGGVGASNVVTFDEDPANALIIGAINPVTHTPNVGSIVSVLYQATITSLKDANGNAVFNYGSAGNVPGQLTITGMFNERITNLTVDPQGNQTIQLSMAGVAQPTNGFNMFYNTTATFNNLTGQNFQAGTLIWSGTAAQDGVGSFTAVGSTVNATGGGPLDQFVTNNYPNINSISGGGGTNNLTVTSTFRNPNFFLTDVVGQQLALAFNTSIVLPFSSVDPAATMFNGTPAAGPGNLIGPVNGFSGPNLLLQADANSSFIPEPSSIVMALTAMGSLSTLAVLRKSRRQKVESVA